MNDPLLHSSKQSYLKYVVDLLNLSLSNGVKISPKKCQLFRIQVQYMGNTTFKDKKVCIKPLKTKLEAIQKLKAPKMAKDYKSFAGEVSYFSMFCPNLQKLLKAIYII